MADPQASSASETSRNRTDGPPAGQTTQPKSPGAQSPTSKSEPRSFEETRSGQGAAAEALTQATQPFVEGGRQLAEHGRRASRQMADGWRQAVDPLLAMQLEMSQWFDDMFRHTFGFGRAPGVHPLRPLGLGAASLFGLPPADMKETGEAHILALELPGLTRQDIDLAVEGDSLVITGHKSEEADDASATYRVSERRYGRFERAFTLPLDVDRARIAAQFKDGVLRITMPKNPDAAKPRARIQISG